MRRGEVWWAHLPRPAGKRPVLLLSRDAAIQVRQAVTAAQITRTIRHIPTEVLLGKKEGMPKTCVVNADVLLTIPKSVLLRRICALPFKKMRAVEQAVKFALALD
ncbi:MAG: type II toxin-antitoxin system PemK/MazF family toxin [Elusimicrobiota bacterium]